MKRQASIQNFFLQKNSINRPVGDSAEVGCASNNVSSGVANTSTVDPAPADETTDICQIEQFSLCVQYGEDQSYKIREDFLTFFPVCDVTGAGLS
ncbi:hypothetical protein AVEN_238836-1 [Araneus ventricosus]|uniref:Uncharacterized protein n=1 Tax=Araneus ventricosus TaxID=182803 RepID=A0A4Y2UCP9_ARAVE|nr:hypothetical protein AVEN_238836-1 [Araneus ventricosus]